jgi:predicted nuclease of predicted toxin-antitoxin system
MLFLADEHIPYTSIRILQDAGHDVLGVSKDCPSLEDLEILRLADSEGRIVITCDRDFGELIYNQGTQFGSGVIFFRIGRFRPEEPAVMILRQIEFGSIFNNRFSVITRTRFRQKDL